MVCPFFRMSNLMCASLCTADKMCNAYNYSKASGCIPGNATALVGVNPNSENTTFVFINAALVPGGMSFDHCQPLQSTAVLAGRDDYSHDCSPRDD